MSPLRFSEAGYYTWRNKFGGMKVSDAMRLKALETENSRLKRLLAESLLENEVTREALRKTITATAKRELVLFMGQRGLSERRSLAVVGMSASAFRYQPVADRSACLRAEILHFAQRYGRYGAPMIYLRLRQAGWTVNHKRVERRYAKQCLQVLRRRCNMVPLYDRQLLIRPARANEVRSMDFVFDRIADGRAIKCLGIVGDATHECVVLMPAQSMSGVQISCVLDELAFTRGLATVIRSDNVPEFIGETMLNWAHHNGVQLKQIQPGKPNQNVYIEFFNGRFRDEYLNERWFMT